MNILKHLDLLSIVHFAIYFTIGLYLKGHYGLILVIGVLWELFEYFIANNPQINKILCKFWPIPKKYWSDSFEHSMVDLLINMIGYYVGNQF